jgi:hypothetical protein
LKRKKTGAGPHSAIFALYHQGPILVVKLKIVNSGSLDVLVGVNLLRATRSGADRPALSVASFFQILPAGSFGRFFFQILPTGSFGRFFFQILPAGSLCFLDRRPPGSFLSARTRPWALRPA